MSVREETNWSIGKQLVRSMKLKVGSSESSANLANL
jgi:hypothetical protein